MRTLILLALIPFVGAADLYGRQESREYPLVGSWTANLTKSKPHPSYPIKGATLIISATGNSVTLASTVVFVSGQEQSASETFPTDGSERPGSHTPGVTVLGKWVGPHLLETRAKKDCQEIALAKYEVSADGKTLTATTSGAAALDQVIVFERN
jgi:hypothetical protein